MISKDKKLLVIGMLAGAVVAAAFMAAFLFRGETARAAMQSHEQISAPTPRGNAEVAPVGTEPGTTVQLDADEINAAGVQLVKVSAARLKSTVESVGRLEQPEA